MKLLVACLTVFFLSISAVSTVRAGCEEDCKNDPMGCFDGFHEDGTIRTCSGKAERTFSMPSLKAGFVVDLYTLDILPHMSLELAEFSFPFLGDMSADVGVATSRLYLSVTWEVIPIVKIGPTLGALCSICS